MQAIEFIDDPESGLDMPVKIFKAISDPARIRILNLLIHSNELCNCHVESITGYSNSKISRHFSTLKAVDLVRRRRDGLWIYYSVNHTDKWNLQFILDFVAKMKHENKTLQDDLANLESQKLGISSCNNC